MKYARALVWVLLAGCSSGTASPDASGTAGTSAGAGGSAGATGGSAGAAGGSAGRGGTTGGGGRGGSTGGAAGAAGGRGGAAGSAAGSGGTGGSAVSCPFVSGPTCPAFTACGGDLVGAWTIDSACYSATQLVWVGTLGCNEVDVSKATETLSGTWTFGSDMTYSRSLTDQMTLEFTEPITCDSSASACSDVRVLDYAATCTGTGCCSCTQVRPTSTHADSGTYAVSGSTVTLTMTGGSKLPYQYCVNGNTVTLSVQAGSLITAHR